MASLREIGKHDEDHHFKDFTSIVDEHLQVEMSMAMLNLEQLMLVDGEEFAKEQEKIDLHEKMARLESTLVLKNKSYIPLGLISKMKNLKNQPHYN